MAKPGLKHEEDLLSWVFAFLIHYTNNPPVQTAETISEMSQRYYSSKTDRSKLPSSAFGCPRAPWRLPSLLVVSEPLPHPAPSPETVTEAACPFMLKIALSGKGSVNLLPREHRCVCDALCGSGHLRCLLLRGGSGVSEMASLLNRTSVPFCC